MLFLPPLRRATGVLTLAAMFFACDAEPNPSSLSGSLDPSVPTLPSASGSPVAFGHNQNPVHAGDFADPFVLPADSVYYAYATNVGALNIPMLRSSDLIHWTPAGDAMPALSGWAVSGRRLTWAPAVTKVGDHFLMFYTARDWSSGRQCIGRAESSTPVGPFIDPSSAPFICQTDLGGSIDPSVVHDGDQLYVIWKNDGNCCGEPVTLWSQRLSQDGGAMTGAPAALLQPDKPWEGPLIEAPTMWEENGGWHLLYSANKWDTDQYAMGYAVCDAPVGPCRKSGGGPVMSSDAETAGPGGAEVFTDLRGQRWAAYHGWNPSNVGYRNGGARSLRLSRVELTEVDSAVNVAALTDRPE
jgi:beta-xylosidase